MPPSVGDKVILVNGTIKADRVAMRDFKFWLPYTKAHLCDGVQYAPSFESLVKLPIPQIGFILAVIIKIIRVNRKVNGERLSNCSLKVKADSWQRIMRKVFIEENKRCILLDQNHETRRFDYITDPRLQHLKVSLLVKLCLSK